MSLESISKNDFLFFQNDILKDIKEIKSTLENKIAQVNQGLILKITEQDSIISKLTENINEVLAKYASSKHDNQRIEELLKMRATINDSISDCKTQINLVNRSLNSAISKYDTIIIDNLNLPGIVGYSCKYKNFKEFFEFINTEIKAFNLFKSQQAAIMKKYREDLKNFEKKEETDILETINKTNKYCDTKFKEYEKILEDKFNTTQDLVLATRIENSQNAMKLIEKTKELEEYHDKLKEIKKEIYEDNEKQLEKFKKEVENNNKIFTKNENDFQVLKQRFTQLSQFIKDIRFQRNIKHEKYENMAKKIDFNRNQKFKDDYDMNLYNEIAKDVIAYINNNNEEEKNKPEVERRKGRTASVMINKFNKDLINNSIFKKLRNSTRPSIDFTNKIDIKESLKTKKRNSVVLRKPEFINNKIKLAESPKTIKKEKKILKNNNNANFKTNNENIKKEKEKEIISFSKSKEEKSSSSSSSSSSKSSSLYSSCSYSSKKNNSKNKEEKKSERENVKKQEYKSINIQNENKEVNTKKANINDNQIKAIKEEYGNRARLMSLDYMASNRFRYGQSNKEVTLFNAFDNKNNNTPKIIEKPKIVSTKKINLKAKNFYFSNKNLYLKTENNLNLKNQDNDLTLNPNTNTIIKTNANAFYPNIKLNSEKKSNKKILLFHTNKKGININLNMNMNKKNINKKEDNIDISKISFQIEKTKNLNINNDIKKETPKQIIHEIVEIKFNKKEGVKKYGKDDLMIQEGDKFNIERIIINKADILKEYKEIIKLRKENLKENQKSDNIKINDNNSVNSVNSGNSSSIMEREFEKEQNKINFKIIKEKINKMNLDNKELNSKINVLEGKYTPVIGQMNDIVHILSLIYNTIKKEKTNQTFTIIHTTTNNINNNQNIGNSKQKNIFKDIFKEDNNKKVNKLNNSYKKKNLNRNNDINHKIINEEDNNIENDNFDQLSKDELNILLRKIEPFLIKKFSKKKE